MSSVSSYKRKYDSVVIPSSKKVKYESSPVDANRAMEVYRKYIKYHGTDKKYANSIRQHGMDIERKTSGSTSLLNKNYGLDDPHAIRYNYVMTLKEAAEYAKMFPKPHIVALIVPPSISLEIDPEGNSRTAFRTHQLIPSYLVLPKHRSDLHRNQLIKINAELGIRDLSKEQLKKLKKMIKEEFMGRHVHVIEQASSFLEQENERDRLTKSAMAALGIDLSSLKEGDEISIPLDLD